ncbi:fused MFS/spermidine synthase [Roseiarcaceae bacterium H3SJ34-1]|uniref:spermidine synthase n=1 Tax=Terripilifer ovatus TaxID=3032367 RepID=UPI003AB9779A|nr:fused MFS/spermidine synthase [Roseiarcaceae bacterium H3SJ34-1]
MSTLDVETRRSASGTILGRQVLPIFAATIFTSALLLFALEPMFAKMALPSLGGAPSVWSIAMVFFQGLMFAGYCYAHAVTRWMTPRHGALLHAVLLCLAFVFLPVALHASGAPPAEGNPAFWLIGVFMVSVGLPFFVLSAHGPLLQAWFARSGHRQADDPYFLYGASNIGSFAALIAYPLVIEPLFGLTAQSRAWTAGFVALTILIVACTLSVFARSDAGAMAATPVRDPDAGQPVRLSSALSWMALAFVPSALLVSVTAHISADVAAAPLLWVIPLAIYLLTFVLTFRPQTAIKETVLAVLQPWIAAAVLMTMCIGKLPFISLNLLSDLVLFIVNALVCHAALYRHRPQAHDLTVFYAAMSLGGALGGLFAGLAAPMLFSSVIEYPLLIAAALFCRPGVFADLRALDRTSALRTAATALGMLAAAWMLIFVATPDIAYKVLAAAIGALVLLNWRSAGRVAVFGLAATAGILLQQNLTSSRESFRSFFGVHRIEEAHDGKFRTLSHGTTIHGAIRIRNEDGTPVSGPPMPTTYYAPQGPLGEAIAAARLTNGKIGHAAFIGLGVGALACHVQAGEAVTFYEIDRLVLHIARDSGRFRFLSDCAPQAKFVLGDARLTLEGQQQASDVIVVDAFSSDAIPTHLLTREAFELYLRKLSPEGLIAVHISNNTMEFHAIIARIAADLGLVAYLRRDLAIPPDDPDFRTASVVAVLARDPAHLRGLLGENSRWRRLEPNMASWVWTDDYSTILRAIADKLRQ